MSETQETPPADAGAVVDAAPDEAVTEAAVTEAGAPSEPADPVVADPVPPDPRAVLSSKVASVRDAAAQSKHNLMLDRLADAVVSLCDAIIEHVQPKA